jgi:hypothetical protein
MEKDYQCRHIVGFCDVESTESEAKINRWTYTPQRRKLNTVWGDSKMVLVLNFHSVDECGGYGP